MGSMSSNPLGKDTKNLTVNVDKEVYDSVRELAAASGVKLSEYLRAIILEAKRNNFQIEVVSKAVKTEPLEFQVNTKLEIEGKISDRLEAVMNRLDEIESTIQESINPTIPSAAEEPSSYGPPPKVELVPKKKPPFKKEA